MSRKADEKPHQTGDFGLGDLGDLSDFTPASSAAPTTPATPESRPRAAVLREIAAEGKKRGFVSREPDTPIRVRRPASGEPTTSLYLRLSVPEFNRYVLMSQRAGQGRADFLSTLMDAYDASTGKK